MEVPWHPSNTEPIYPLRAPYNAPKPEAEWSRYDFIDLASKNGGSIEAMQKRFGGRGIGIDRSAIFVAKMQAKGIDAVHGDAEQLDCEKAVRFVSAMNFLEHLPDLAAVEAMLARMARAATHFMFIRHPSFEGEETAVRRGFRVDHWNWHHHSAHVRLADFRAMFGRLGLGTYDIRNVDPITHSDHEHVIATALPMDLNSKTAAGLAKPSEPIDPPWFVRHDIIVALKPVSPKYWAKLTRPKESVTLGL